jgi:hypothetical protein
MSTLIISPIPKLSTRLTKKLLVLKSNIMTALEWLGVLWIAELVIKLVIPG